MNKRQNIKQAPKIQPVEEFRQFEENTNIYKQMFQFSPFPIIIHDMEMNIVDANRKALEQFGYSKKELLAMSIADLHTEEEPENASRVLDSIQAKDNQGVETRFTRKDGSVFVAEATPFKYKLGKKPLIHVYIQDITQRKEDELKVVNAMKKAEESDRLKSAFLANMSHEIRTPMNSILGFMHLLKRSFLDGKEKKSYINIMEKSGERLLKLVDDVIRISKIEAGLVESRIEILDINEQIENFYVLFKPEADRIGIDLKFSRPSSTARTLVKTDSEKLMAVLTNLLKNALKHTEEGTVEFGYKQQESKLEFYVKDTGIGIPENRMDAIFERFVQADIEDKAARQGSGLGLSISKAYVEILGGEIGVESKEGVGSTFYFTIPYSAPKIKSDPEKNIEKLKAEPDNEGLGLKILIAEDDEFSYSLLKIMLEHVGDEILHAVTGAKAVEMARNNPDIDLILMDIKMPGMTGYEATSEIRTFNEHVVIIAQTANVMRRDKQKAIESGCNAYISKPVTEDDLQTLLKRYFMN
ncbi:MAG TPA: ATP-binding protein [Prolixibacteraceae bacterium]|nr:ATP-binding protein [Prolixibacteraceae bacterium]